MKASVYFNYGPPEIVKIMEVDKPVAKANELFIKVHASTVNRTDCGFRSANYFISRFFSGLFRPTNKILGCEFAGEIEAVGTSVTTFKPGDRVFGFNDKTFGGHAEYMVVTENSPVTTIPDNTPYSLAAAFVEGAHYALCDLRAANIKPGQKFLINGTTGAIGSAAVQLAKHFGATVTAVCDTKNIELVRSLGADVVIDYLKDDFTLLEQQFDCVFDAVGKSTFRKCKPLLKAKGIYMSTELGPGGQNPFLAITTSLLGGKKLLFPIPTISKDDVIFLKTLFEKGEYKPVIDRSFSLDKIVDAYTYVETGMKTGNVIITITE